MKKLSLNFSGGPGALPQEVLEQAQEAIIQAPNSNQSILGISHRSEYFKSIMHESDEHFRALLKIPKDYHVLQLQGGSTTQFSMIPILLLRGKNKTAEYLRTGYWSSKSIPDAQREGRVNVLYDGQSEGFSRLPKQGELKHDPNAAYFHWVSNETVEGLQFNYLPGLDSVPRVCDMASDFLSYPMDISKFSIVYAHAQKNLGPSGLTLVILKDSLLKDAPENVHSMLDYNNHVKMESIYNTPPVFAIYVTMLVARWVRNTIGGVEKMKAINDRKARMLYSVIDENPDFFISKVDKDDRSAMNVSFHMPTPELVKQFIAEAIDKGFYGLEGHRSVGGLRASLYNAVTEEDVAKLCEFMSDFRKRVQ